MNTTAAMPSATVEPLRIPTQLWVLLAFALLALFAVTLDNGQLLKSGASAVHEFMHDGRHLLGVPCH